MNTMHKVENRDDDDDDNNNNNKTTAEIWKIVA